jgi:hypothetical protein
MFEKSWLVLIHFAKRIIVLRNGIAERRHKVAMEKYRN